MNADHVVLGCILRDNTRHALAREIISGDDFNSPTLGAIFDRIGEHLAAGGMVDAYTLETHFPAWEIRGVGADEPHRWIDAGAYPELIADAASTVRDAALRRRGRDTFTSALEDLRDTGRDPGEVLQRVSEMLSGTLDDSRAERSAGYVDVAAILDGSLQAPQTAAGGRRSDDLPLLYPSAVNALLGAPEASKTLIAGAMAADELSAGGSVLWVDLDHNGAAAILNRLSEYGVPRETLIDRARFRLAIADNADDVRGIVADARAWAPTLAVVDCIGELLPMFAAKSNDGDDYTAVHREVFAAIAGVGTAVLAIDHEAKGAESRAYGAGGTMAKKRAVDGALLRVTVVRQFAPGAGGEAQMTIVKDRHGALRANAWGSREPIIATFTMTQLPQGLGYAFTPPTRTAQTEAAPDDVSQLLSMAPAPTSVRDVRNRMNWGATRAQNAMRGYRQSIGEPAEAAYLEGAD